MTQPAPTYRPLRDTRGPEQVTGDAVRLDVPPAGIPSRVLAGIIDLLTRLVTFFVVMWIASEMLGDAASEAVTAGVVVLAMAGCFVVGPAIVETLSLGRSLGKLICGLRVVRTDGGAISFRHALVRAFLGYLELFLTFGLVAFATALFTVRSRRLGDLAAGTYVVREVRRLALPPLATMPPELAGWANTATVTPLPQRLAASLTVLARHVSAPRTPAYVAQVQQTLGQVLPYVSPPPPPGHDPVAVLLAVLVLRRDADLRALARDAQIRDRLLAR